MAKQNSKSANSSAKTNAKPRKPSLKTRLAAKLKSLKDFWKNPSPLHRSFRRSYRDEYLQQSQFEAPGLLDHLFDTLKIIAKSWRIFLPLLILTTFAAILLLGVLSEDTYVSYQEAIATSEAESGVNHIGAITKALLLLVTTSTTGGISQDAVTNQTAFGIILIVIVWLITIYVIRQIQSGKTPTFRSAAYNALGPFLSTFATLLVVLIQLLPIFIFIVAYSSALETDLLATPFYAFLFFCFAAVMILISVYCLSSSAIALAAVTAPGLYPGVALRAASRLVAGRRMKFILRLMVLIVAIIITGTVVLVPLILLDLALKSVFTFLAGVPFISVCFICFTVFVVIYTSAYIYLYYRAMLDYDKNQLSS